MGYDEALRLKLMEAARSGSTAYLTAYSESLNTIAPIAASSERRSVRPLVAANSTDAINAVKVSLLYNDISVLTLGASGQAQIRILNPENVPGGRGFTVTVPKDQVEMLEAATRGQVNCGFMFPGSDADNQFFNDVAPLVGQGRVILSPRRMIMYMSSKTTPKGGRVWETHEADPLTPLEVWESQAIAVHDNPIKTVTSQVLDARGGLAAIDASHQLVLPYIEDLPLTEYAKVIEDEADQLASLRVELAAYLKLLADRGFDIEQFRRDVLQPKIDRIERDFQRITAASNIRTGGLVVGTALMCAATVATGGIAAAVAAAAGTAGLVGAAKELGDRYEKVSALKNEPLHLLWRMQQRGQRVL